MSGILTCGTIEVQNDSLALDQLTDVDASVPTHDQVLIYKDTLIDPTYNPSGWYSAGLLIENFTNVNSVTVPSHNEILTYNVNAQDPAYNDGWVNKNISAVFTTLNETISSIVSSTNSVVEGENGNPGKSDMIMFTDTVAATGVINVSIGSAFDNNAIFKRELTDSEFIFVQDLSQGEILDTTYPTGTVFRSTKGIYGFSGPVPTPLGVSSLSFKLTKFSTTLASTTVVISSIGLEVTVTLFESDGITVSDGPTVILANESQSFACNGLGEFVVSSSGAVVGYVNGNGLHKRLLVPMATDILVHNRNHSISSLVGTANVTYYRRDGTTGTDTVTSGTPLTIAAAGSQANWVNNGWLRIISDVPICAYSFDDSDGFQAVPGMPVTQLSQFFPNPSFLDLNVDYSISSISICSLYEGSYTVYDNTGTVLDTGNYTRTGAVTMNPAAARWNPLSVAGGTGTVVLDGGWIETTTPFTCVMNFNGSAVWTGQTGQEMLVVGTTPEISRAEIKLDVSGVARRRDLSATGVVTWTEV